jgi:hypothetical protein
VAAPPGSRAAALRLWRGLGAFAADHPDAFAFLELQQHAGYLDATSRELSAQVEAVAVEVVVAGQRAGRIRAGDPALLIALVFGAFVGLTKHTRAGGPSSGAAALATAEEAVWQLLSGKDRSP